MLTITISNRTLLFAVLLIAAVVTAFYAKDVLAGDPGDQIQGDVNCDLSVDNNDILDHLYHAADFEPLQNEPCTDIGDVLPLGEGPQGPPGPAGPPGPSDFAAVRADGTLAFGTAISATREFEGVYRVTFDHDVTECAAVAAPGLIGGTSVLAFGAAAHTVVGQIVEDNQVRVAIGLASAPTDGIDSTFHLIVAC